MSYVQRYIPKGHDQVTLDFFMKNRLGSMMEPEQAQLVAQQVYDLARVGGVQEGNLTVGTLDAILDKMMQGSITPLANPYEKNIAAATGGPMPGYMAPTGRGGRTGELLPRTAMQSPIEAMRPARYFSTTDGATDFLGTSLYRLIDSSTLGLFGVLGRGLKEIGLTDKNFWTESIGETRSLFGLDFGEGGIKGADTEAGTWGARVGEFAGFAIPIIATMGGALAARGAASAVGRASIGKMIAEKTGKDALAQEFGREIIKHQARGEAIRRRTEKIVTVANKLPANYIFEIGSKAVRRAMYNEGVRGVQSKVVAQAMGRALGAGATATARAFGAEASAITGKSVTQDVLERAVVEASEKAAKEGAFAGAQRGALLSPKALRAAQDATEAGIYEAPEVMAAATNAFRHRFANDIMKKLGIKIKGNEEFFNDLVNNAGKAFDEAFKAARKDGGLMNLHETAFLKGYNRLGVGFSKAVQHSASHVAGMMLMGAASRTFHPIAEPSLFGVDEEDGWEATKGIAAYWLKGAKAGTGEWSPFEGVTGDLLVGAAFGLAGGTNLIPALQKTRSKNPAEMMSRLPGMGGTEQDWKGHLDILDTELESIYKMVRKGQAPGTRGGIAGWVSSLFKRNYADFGDLYDTNPEGFKHVIKKYAKHIRDNEDFFGRYAKPFDETDLDFAMMAHPTHNPNFGNATAADKELYRAARDRIIDGMTRHRARMLQDYNKSNTADLVKDLMRFGVVTTATSIMSAPTLWKEALDGNDDVHPADLVMHTLFAALMARHPYYLDGASVYMPYIKKGAHISPEAMRELHGMRMRNALRHLGIRDSSLILEGTKIRTSPTSGVQSPLEFDGSVNEAYDNAIARGLAHPGKLAEFTLIQDSSQSVAGRPEVDVHEVEIALRTIMDRHESGGVIKDELLQKDKDGKPQLFKKALGDLTDMEGFAQVVGELKRIMVKKGVMREGEKLDLYNIHAMEGEYLTTVIADLSNALGGHPTDAQRTGITARMSEIVEEKDGRIRMVAMGATPDGKDPTKPVMTQDEIANSAAILEGYNELVEIAGLLRKPIDVDADGKPNVEIIDPRGEKMEAIRALVENSQKVMAEILHLPRSRLGKERSLYSFLLSGVVRAKVHHGMVLGIKGGILFTSDGRQISRDSLIRTLIENGFGTTYQTDEGKTQYILWTPDYKALGETPAGVNRPSQASVIRNLYRFLTSTSDVWQAPHSKDGKLLSKETVEKFFSEDALIYDHLGAKIEGRRGGLDAILSDIGLPMDNKFLVQHMAREFTTHGRGRLSREDYEILDLTRAQGLLVRDPVTGDEVFAIPVVARAKARTNRAAKNLVHDHTDKMRGRLEAMIDDLPEEYQAIIDSFGKGEFALAMSKQDMDFLIGVMKRAQAVGEIAGIGVAEPYNPQTGKMDAPRRGKFVVYGERGNEGMTELVGEIKRQRRRSLTDVMKDMAESRKHLERVEAEIAGKQNQSRGDKRRLKITRDILKKIKESQTSARSYLALENAMISSGVLTLKKGKYTLKKNFGTMRDLTKLSKEYERYFQKRREMKVAYDTTAIMHLAEKSAKEAILRMREGGERARVSLDEFFVASGLAMNDQTNLEAHTALEEIHAAMTNGTMSPRAAGAELRQRFDDILSRRLGPNGKKLPHTDDYREILHSVDDNYLLSLVQDAMDTVEIREFTFKGGTAFPQDLPTAGTGAGEGQKKNRKIAGQRPGGAQTTDYLSTPIKASRASRDVSFMRYARVAYLNPEGLGFRDAGLRSAFKDRAFTHGLRARVSEDNGRDEIESVVFLKDASESERYLAVEVPTNRTAAEKFVTEALPLLESYEKRIEQIRSNDLRLVVRDLRFIVDNIQEALAMPAGPISDAAIRSFSLNGELIGARATNEGDITLNKGLSSRLNLYTDVFSFLQLNEYFGPHAVVQAFRKSGTDNLALPKLLTRVKLASTYDDRRISDFEIRSSISMLDKEEAGNDPGKVIRAGADGETLMHYLLNKAGLVRGARTGKLQATFYIYDSEEAQGRSAPNVPEGTKDPKTGKVLTKAERDAITRTRPKQDGGIILNRHLLRLLWHATGHEAFNPNTTYGVGKVRILYVGENGALITKDVMNAQAGATQEMMERANVSGIMSSEAAKVFTGIFEKMIQRATIDYGNGDKDLFGRLNHEEEKVRRTALDGSRPKLHVPLESFIWQHPVDGNPDHATRSAQQAGFKSERFVQSLVELVDANAVDVARTLSQLVGGTGIRERLMQHAYFTAGKNVGLGAGGVNDKYVEYGGHLASQVDYGGAKHYLNSLKTTLLSNYLFKIKTSNGTSEVYTDDSAESLYASEIVQGHKSGLKLTSLDDGMIAFEVANPEEAEKMTSEIHGFGSRSMFYNAAPEEANQTIPTNYVHVRITGKDRRDGIYLGLIDASRVRQGSVVPNYTGLHENGTIDQVGTGARSIMRFMQSLGRAIDGARQVGDTKKVEAYERTRDGVADVVNQAWQTAIKHTGSRAQAQAETAKVLVGLEKIFGRLSGTAQKQFLREIMASRDAMYIDAGDSGLVINNQKVQRFRIHNALSYMFGTYNYYRTSRNVRNNKGSIVNFGLTTMAQRHPSTMINDTMAMVSRGFLDIADGAQVKGFWKDMEDVAKSDQDEDHFHTWYDYTQGEAAEAMRLRSITGGFQDKTESKMPNFSFFMSHNRLERPGPDVVGADETYTEVLSKRRRNAKIGIGLISKSIAMSSAAVHKGVAFKMTRHGERVLVAPLAAVAKDGRLTFGDERGNSVMDLTQERLQANMQELSEMHNTYTDAKSTGVDVDPTKIDLQALVLDNFFGIFKESKRIDPKTGVEETIYLPMEHGHSLKSDEIALTALKAMSSTLYRISSFGKDVFTADGQRKMNIDEMDHMGQRYNAVWGKEANIEQALKWIAQIGLSKKNVDFGKGRKARTISSKMNEDIEKIQDSITVVTPHNLLRNRTVYDAMADGVVRAMDTIYKDDRGAYLSEAERAAGYLGREGAAQADKAVRVAQLSRFVASNDKTSKIARELVRRLGDGEEILAYEAYQAVELHKKSLDYMRKTEAEDGMDRGERHYPTSPLERFKVLNNTIDNLSVNALRAALRPTDRDVDRADERLLEVFSIHKALSGDFKKFYDKEYAKRPEDFTDMDIISMETREMVFSFLRKWGGRNGENLAVAALDLLTPHPNGFFIDARGQEHPTYKPFKHGIFNAIQEFMSGGMVGDYGHITPEMRQAQGAHLFEGMARTRAIMSSIYASDDYALASAHDMIDTIASQGRSYVSASQFINLKTSSRQKASRDNVFLAALNKDFQEIMGSITNLNFKNPHLNRYGFSTNRDASRFLADLQDQKPYTQRIRLNSHLKRHSISQIRQELLAENIDAAVTAIDIAESSQRVTSDAERLLQRGEWANVKEIEKRRVKAGKEKTEYDDKVQLVKKREQALVNLLIRSLSATDPSRSNVLPHNAFSRGGGLAQQQAEMLLKHCY